MVFRQIKDCRDGKWSFFLDGIKTTKSKYDSTRKALKVFEIPRKSFAFYVKDDCIVIEFAKQC